MWAGCAGWWCGAVAAAAALAALAACRRRGRRPLALAALAPPRVVVLPAARSPSLERDAMEPEPGLRRFRSASARLDACGADALAEPRFYTPPEAAEPLFFAEPSPKSVYYDSVRSPKFFPDTPREEPPRSPRALAEHANRNDEPGSPRRASPRAPSRDKENRFAFEPRRPRLKSLSLDSAEAEPADAGERPRFLLRVDAEGRRSPAADAGAPPEPEAAPRRGRNPRNLTIDLSKRDSQLERELLEFDAQFRSKVRTPTLKVKATSLDSSEAGPALARRDAAASASVPNTPQRQPRRVLAKPRGLAPPDAGPLGYKQGLSASSTNLKTLPEGVPSDDFAPGAEEAPRRLLRRDSSQSLQPEAPRGCLLQRRGSNNSLTLSIHSGKGPERRGSSASLSLADGLAARKALSSEHLPRARPAFGSTDELRRREPPAERSITTEPLSPQTTSEDFRLYLANMQQLQNASSVLSRRRLRELHDVFANGYAKAPAPRACSEQQKALLRNLHQEFWDMPTNFQEKPIVSGSHPKNRYRTILPNEHSRVILRADAGSAEGYINANFIKGHESTKNSYIATQGPLQNTMYDFWLMVQQNCLQHAPAAAQKVVMLTNFVENNRQKCEKYFPLELHEEVAIAGADAAGRFRVRADALLRKPGYTVRRLRVRHEPGGASELTVLHYWFHNWADHKCPADVDALLSLSLDVLREAPPDFAGGAESRFPFPPPSPSPGAPPPIVHCSAGIGRTGCLIAILNGIRQLGAEHKVDVLAIVCNMRLNRGGMVQTSEQYELIHKVLCLYEQACLPRL